MTVDVLALEQAIKSANKGKGQLAREMNMDQATFYRKMNSNGEKFTVGEMHKLIDVLGMSRESAVAVFLFQNSQ